MTKGAATSEIRSALAAKIQKLQDELNMLEDSVVESGGSGDEQVLSNVGKN